MSDTDSFVPRRSGRVSSHTLLTDVVVKAKATISRKRKAEPKNDGGEVEAEGSTSKKAKTAKDDGAGLVIGDFLPNDVVLKNQDDEELDSSKLNEDSEGKQGKGVVIFTVPKANTPGCTRQAMGFGSSHSSFTEAGFQVYCLSADKPGSLKNWKEKKSLPYTLLSDPSRKLITKLGAANPGKASAKRTHFVFQAAEGEGLKLVEKKVPVKPEESPTLALGTVQGLS